MRHNKYLLIFLMFLLSSRATCQDYYEKWSNIQNRYEYYDTDGNLVGYKKWSNLHSRWEYHTIKSENNSRITTYPQYENTQDIELINKVLASKQDRYNYNVQRVQNHIDKLSNNFKTISDSEQRIFALKELSDVIQSFNKKNPHIDYSSNSHATSVINYFSNAYNDIVSKLSDRYNKINSVNNSKARTLTPSGQVHKDKSKFSVNSYVSTFSYAPILDSPETSAKQIGSVENNKAYILGKENYSYYKIKSGNTIGYISVNWLKEAVNASEEKNNSTLTIPKNVFGSYLVDKIEEYTLNTITGEKIIKNIINEESKLILSEETIFFQRYGEPEKGSSIKYLGFDSESNKYRFEDNYNQYIYLDKELTTISWIEKSTSTLKKVFTYYGLKKMSP